MWTLRRNSVLRILYVFPHPDDESFGPARAMAAQKRQGHAVYLLNSLAAKRPRCGTASDGLLSKWARFVIANC
jgi:hypothetical protein